MPASHNNLSAWNVVLSLYFSFPLVPAPSHYNLPCSHVARSEVGPWSGAMMMMMFGQNNVLYINGMRAEARQEVGDNDAVNSPQDLGLFCWPDFIDILNLPGRLNDS